MFLSRNVQAVAASACCVHSDSSGLDTSASVHVRSSLRIFTAALPLNAAGVVVAGVRARAMRCFLLPALPSCQQRAQRAVRIMRFCAVSLLVLRK